MAVRTRKKRAKVRGKRTKAQLPPSLTDVVLETTRLWRKHHLGYDQTKYVVEQARRRLKLKPPGTRRRTVDRLEKPEVERLIRNTYQSHSKYGLMIKTWIECGKTPTVVQATLLNGGFRLDVTSTPLSASQLMPAG